MNLKRLFLYLVPLCVLTTSCNFINKNNSREYTKPIYDPINTLDPSKTRFRTDYMIAKSIL